MEYNKIYKILLKVSFIPIILPLFIQPLIGQKWNFGIGLELNSTNLKTRADVTVPYRIGFTPNIGYSGNLTLEYKVHEYVNISLTPGIGNHRMSINDGRKGSYLHMNHLDVVLGSRLAFNGITLGFEFGMSSFFDIYSIQNSQDSDLNKYIINKNLLNHSFYLGINILGDSYIYFKSARYHGDLFTTNGVDNLGREILPIYVTPKYYSLGFKFFLPDKPKQ